MVRSSGLSAGRSVVAAGTIAIGGSRCPLRLQFRRSTKTFGVRVAVVVLTAALLVACSSGPSAPDDSKYIDQLSAARAQKDQAFRSDPDSPIPAEKRDVILPLPYYPIDPNYAVPAVLRLAAERPVFEMLTSSGEPRRMQLVGVLEFTLDGQTRSLGAFVEEGVDQVTKLFVPFADQTTGKETYSAGRYLDIFSTATGYYTIDFNTAYNPYCAYNAAFECPFPPSSNRLATEVRAGEKTPPA